MKYLKFAQLCWKAYNGDPKAALEVVKILISKAPALKAQVSKLKVK